VTQSYDHPLKGAASRRRLLNISAADIAKGLGINRTSYLRLERGERVIQFPKALSLAKLLHCSCEELGLEPSLDDKIAMLRRAEEHRSVVVAQVPTAGTGADLVQAMQEMPHSSGDIIPGLPDDVAAMLRDAGEGE
jgi:transcriptional regulator with XRE-family HTH domain